MTQKKRRKTRETRKRLKRRSVECGKLKKKITKKKDVEGTEIKWAREDREENKTGGM